MTDDEVTRARELFDAFCEEDSRRENADDNWWIRFALYYAAESRKLLEDQIATAAEHFDLAPHDGCDCKMCSALREITRLRAEGQRVDADADKWMSRAAKAETEVERLRAERDALREALSKVKIEYSRNHGEPNPTPPFPVRAVFSLENWKKVEAALSASPPATETPAKWCCAGPDKGQNDGESHAPHCQYHSSHWGERTASPLASLSAEDISHITEAEARQHVHGKTSPPAAEETKKP